MTEGQDQDPAQPPHDLVAEKAILGAVLALGVSAFNEARDHLSGDEFYLPRHKAIWKAANTLSEKGSAIDFITVNDALETSGKLSLVGGTEYLLGLSTGATTAASVPHWAKIVWNKWRRRVAIENASALIAMAKDPTSEIEDIVDAANKIVLGFDEGASASDYRTLKDVVIEEYERIEKSLETGQLPGISTGIVGFDSLLGPICPGDLIVLAARPGVGKSALAGTIVGNLSAWNTDPAKLLPSLWFSLEMPAMDMAQRWISSTSGVHLNRIRSLDLCDEDWQPIFQSITQLSAAKSLLNLTPGLRMSQLRSVARKAKADQNIGLIVVDYLQLMEPESEGGESRQNDVSKISRGLKNLAMELKIPVIALSQLSRKVEEQKRRPILSDLRESGAIEQDADGVIFLVRDVNPKWAGDQDFNPEKATAIVAKRRNGATGEVELRYKPKVVTFTDPIGDDRQ